MWCSVRLAWVEMTTNLPNHFVPMAPNLLYFYHFSGIKGRVGTTNFIVQWLFGISEIKAFKLLEICRGTFQFVQFGVQGKAEIQRGNGLNALKSAAYHEEGFESWTPPLGCAKPRNYLFSYNFFYFALPNNQSSVAYRHH